MSLKELVVEFLKANPEASNKEIFAYVGKKMGWSKRKISAKPLSGTMLRLAKEEALEGNEDIENTDGNDNQLEIARLLFMKDRKMTFVKAKKLIEQRSGKELGKSIISRVRTELHINTELEKVQLLKDLLLKYPKNTFAEIIKKAKKVMPEEVFYPKLVSLAKHSKPMPIKEATERGEKRLRHSFKSLYNRDKSIGFKEFKTEDPYPIQLNNTEDCDIPKSRVDCKKNNIEFLTKRYSVISTIPYTEIVKDALNKTVTLINEELGNNKFELVHTLMTDNQSLELRSIQ